MRRDSNYNAHLSDRDVKGVEGWRLRDGNCNSLPCSKHCIIDHPLRVGLISTVRLCQYPMCLQNRGPTRNRNSVQLMKQCTCETATCVCPYDKLYRGCGNQSLEKVWESGARWKKQGQYTLVYSSILQYTLVYFQYIPDLAVHLKCSDSAYSPSVVTGCCKYLVASW